MFDRKYFCAHIRELRESRGLTLESLAREIGSNKTTTARWEAGTRLPNVENLWQLADYFGITLDELVGRKI